MSFDSILVRLKGRVKIPNQLGRLSFDSILVRLKVWIYSRTDSHILLFRFHTGSIKRATGKTKRESDTQLRFDSILVRLKVHGEIIQGNLF